MHTKCLMYIMHKMHMRHAKRITCFMCKNGEKMKKVYVITNQKGGVGKTTSATALARILQAKGMKTLLIDADQQGNSSDTYRAEIEGHATLYDVLLEDDRIPLKDAIQKTEMGDIVASDPLLREGDIKLASDIEGVYRLSEAIEQLDGYDYVVIDTAPALNHILYNCLIASDEVIIPVTADRYGLQGLAQLSEAVKKIKKRQNPKLKIAGLLLVKYNGRTLLSREVSQSLDKIAEDMGTKVFTAKIRESTKTREAQAMRKSLIDYAEKSTTAEDYKEFVEELLEG